MRVLRILLLLAMPLCVPVRAQDIHFTQFFNSPLALGPGQIGQFDGQYRFNGIYRQQWRSVTVPYRTFGFGADAARLLGLNGLGGGLWMYNDRAGDGRLNTFHVDLGASWTERFGQDKAHALTGGLQVGLTTISVDNSAFRFDAQYNGFYYDPGLDDAESFVRSSMVHPDLHLGVLYKYTMAPRRYVEAGASLFNLTRPEIGFLGGPGAPLDTRGVFHVRTSFPVSDDLDVLPMLQYMDQGRFRALNIGGVLRYIMLEQYGLLRTLQVGAFYRAADAGNLYAGLEYDDWTFGVSYDINLSDLVPASNNRGALELSAIYIIRQRPLLPARFKACPVQL